VKTRQERENDPSGGRYLSLERAAPVPRVGPKFGGGERKYCPRLAGRARIGFNFPPQRGQCALSRAEPSRAAPSWAGGPLMATVMIRTWRARAGGARRGRQVGAGGLPSARAKRETG